jgi:anti-sigma B factor antagonist
MPAHLNTEVHGDVRVAYLREARILDEATIQEIGAALTQLVNQTTDQKLVLNFQNVKFMSSAMLGKLVALNKLCKNSKVALKLSNISPDIMQIFKLTALDKVFDISPDEATALAAFASKGGIIK